MWAGLVSYTAPILSWKSRRNDTDQQEIRRTTFSMSPRAKPHKTGLPPKRDNVTGGY